jgi:hypothetical protein
VAVGAHENDGIDGWRRASVYASAADGQQQAGCRTISKIRVRAQSKDRF